ncbi:MAG: dehydrogenase [Rhodospirillaceae bacterium]|nr:dehydrogenase [Rhodospirillaceae bacterium]
MSNSKYRVGVSPRIRRADGSPVFPAYDLGPLAEAADIELDLLPREKILTRETLDEFDAVILFLEQVREQSFAGGDPVRLTHIARFGVGYDTIDVPACSANDVVLTITPDGVRRPMGQAIMALLLAMVGNLLPKDRIARGGAQAWPESGDFHGRGLVGLTLGTVGCGNIGTEMFRLAKPFDMRFIAHDPYVDAAEKGELGIEMVDLESVFRRSDILTFNCWLSDETCGIGSRERLALMKPDAFLINTSRGPVVDQPALLEVLQERRIAGAALDVFDPEPPGPDDPILALDNVVLTPHALGHTDQMHALFGEINCTAIQTVLSGQVPANVVNNDVLESAGLQAKLARLGAA